MGFDPFSGEKLLSFVHRLSMTWIHPISNKLAPVKGAKLPDFS
jgi:hypothetical protein